MIRIAHGNLLKAHADALVNTVNTAGVMGRGIALQFKQAYPEVFRAYEKACKAGEVTIGKIFVCDVGGLAGGPRWILNFPTKTHWKTRSRLPDIEEGLKDLVRTARRLGLKSIAVPPLGCGNGGLKWKDVGPRIEAALGELKDVDVLIYPPGDAPVAAAMPNRTERPAMTIGRAALIALVDRYLKGLLDPVISLLEIHKLMYFMQEAGEPLNLTFEPKAFGPYSTNLRHVLTRLEKHYTVGYGDGKDSPEKQIELLPGATDEAHRLLKDNPAAQARLDRVFRLVDGFEDPYGLELLSTVHWIMRHEKGAGESLDVVIPAVQRWSPRKKRIMKSEHLRKAWERLRKANWHQASSDVA